MSDAHPAQPGIFHTEPRHAYFMEYALPIDFDLEVFRNALICLRVAAIAEKQASIDVVFAFGPGPWLKLGGQMPAAWRPFDELKGAGYVAPSTQCDLLVWLQGTCSDTLFKLALSFHQSVCAIASLEREVTGFEYLDSRDLIGFVDGTANPTEDVRYATALIPDGKAGAGGSFVMSQKWVHNMPDFNALPLAEQEAVVGRTKVDDIELEGDAMPPTSHVSRTDVQVQGVAQKIWRRSSPYGSLQEHGLYFLAFACDLSRFDIQLRRMYGLTEDGLSDRLLEFSRAISGSYFFAPTQVALDEALS